MMMTERIAPKKKVLFLLKDLTLGGTERVCLNLLRHLPQDSFSCDLFTCGDSRLLLDELPAHVSLISGVSSKLRMRQAFLPLVRQLRRIIGNYDVVVATNPDTTTLMHVAGVGHNVRKVSWVHFNAESFLPSATRLIRLESRLFYSRTIERVFLSTGVRDSFVRLFGASAGDVLIPNLFDPSAYTKPSTVVSQIQQLKAQGHVVLGFVGRLAPEKGLPELLAIHKSLLGWGFAHKLAIIGDGPLRDWLQSEVRSHNLSEILLLGADPSPLEAIRACDLMLMTSHHEAWPTVVLESLFAGTPLIAYDCPSGPREMLTGPLQSCLVPFGNVDAFCEATINAMEIKGDLGTAGFQRVQEFFPEQVAPRWARFLEADCPLVR